MAQQTITLPRARTGIIPHTGMIDRRREQETRLCGFA
jgi:hypothetical protein